MIPGGDPTLNSETHVTQIEIQNEIKTPEIKKPVNNIVTSVNYSELLRQENKKECNINTEIKDTLINRDTADSKAQECGNLFTDNNLNKMEIGFTNIKKEGLSPKSKKLGNYPTEYWVQYSQETEPMEYAPDRNAFVAKVFFLTFLMLLITASFVAFVLLSDDMRELFIGTNLGKMCVLGGIGGMILLNYKVMCSPCMRMFPCNFISLIIAVICMSVIAAYITALHSTTLVIYALFSTAITVFVCFLLALTSFDFTKYILYVFVIAIVLFALSGVVLAGQLITGTKFKLLHVIILFVGTIVNVVALIINLQLILGGKTVQLSEDDYALGALMLYTSIVDLFLKLLQIMGLALDEDGDFFSDLL